MSADVAVGFLLSNLTQLLKYHVALITGVKGDAEQLQNDLELLETFVRDSARKRRSHPALQVLVNQIRDMVYEAEDNIDTYVTAVAVQKARNLLYKAFHIVDHPAELRNVAERIKSIGAKVSDIYQNKTFGLKELLADEGGPVSRKAPQVEEGDDVVGFDEEAQTVIDRLSTKSTNLEVLTIVGLPGLGKTTLARKIFKDPKIEYEYFVRAWAYVSQDYVKKDVLLSILRCVTNITEEIRHMGEEELAEKLKEELMGVSYFIVMDDVWSADAWNDLKSAFPKNSKGSRILITSRHKAVAKAAHSGNPHDLKFLTPNESWQLLKKKVFGKEMPPPELTEIGEKIALNCDGVPLTIVVIAGILLDKGFHDDKWRDVEKSKMLTADKCNEAVQMSYDQLPYHLKACFLYFGVFPEDFEVPVWRLIRLWIGEGFIKKKPTDEVSLEVIAEGYLQELVDRNLVIVGKWKWNGHIKTCRVHDLMYFFCKKEAAAEIFFQEINSGLSREEIANCRRLSIHSKVQSYISSGPTGQRVRSLLCFSLDNTTLSRDQVSAIPGAFKLLRVLDTKPIIFPLFPPDFAQLIHLRYLALSGEFKILPKTISALWNMQTLIINTSSRTLEIKGENLWKMLQLRHVHCNASITLPSPPSKAPNAENLQTMTAIQPEICAEGILAKTPNLKKLGVRGKLAKLFAEKGGSSLFNNVGKLQQLENLKLLNDESLDGQQNEGRLLVLPQQYRFPPKLKKLTLSETSLEWSQMSILATLGNLQVLKLKDFAFRGETWTDQGEGGFRQLKVLQVERTNLMSWHASARHFPRLECVFLRNCSSLKILPSELAEIPSLHVMDLYCVTPDAAKYAKDIADSKKEKKVDEQSREFKLSIYPPDHMPKNRKTIF